jgi:hypothetical protein
MGYACPVCDVPQRDAEHLANHLAFTAMLHGDDHETWLDENVDDWASKNGDTLGPTVASLAEETQYDEVFEDTVHDQSGHGRGGSLFDDAQGGEGGRAGVDAAAAERRGGGELDAETRDVLREARELTAEMYSDADAEDGDDRSGGEADGGDGDEADR